MPFFSVYYLVNSYSLVKAPASVLLPCSQKSGTTGGHSQLIVRHGVGPRPMSPGNGSNRLLGAQEGPGGQLILKYNLLGPCPVCSGLRLAQRAGRAGFEASRHQSLQMPQESWFGVNEGQPGSIIQGGMYPLPRLSLGTFLPFRLTGGPGPGGRVCKFPREPRVCGASRVGIGFGVVPLGRPRTGGRALREESWPARGGGGRRADCGHRRRMRLEEGKVGGLTGKLLTERPILHQRRVLQLRPHLHRRTPLAFRDPQTLPPSA